MKIKRYFAENIRQAMQMVRDELGADAVIMSNRKVEGGVEIVAARDFDEQSVRSNVPAQGREVEPDFFKPSKSAKQIRKVDLPDFQADRNNLHVISSPRKKEEPVFSSSSAKRGIDKYVGYAEKVQLRGNPEAVKHHFSTPAPASKPSVPSVMIKVPKKSTAKPQPQYIEQMPQRESMYQENYHREPPEPRYQEPRYEEPMYREPRGEMYREPVAAQRAPIMPNVRETKAEVRNEAHDLRQHFSAKADDYVDEFDELLEEVVEAEIETYEKPKFAEVMQKRVEPAIDEMPKEVLDDDEKERVSSKLLSEVTKELKSLRSTLDTKLSRINFAARHAANPNSTPIRSELLHKLAVMSISKKLSIKIANRFANHTNFDFVFTQAQELLAKVLPITNDNLLETGGVVALVGPTGVGKTTSVAKIAAQFTLKHGANQVALITTDNYRIAAHEQLNTYGRILNIPVRTASSAEELRQLIQSFSDKKLVLIDTAGMSQRDMKLIEQINTLKENNVSIKSYLVMSAATEYKAMNEIIDAFHIFKPQAAILTKLDEAATIGSALSSLIEHNLALSFITNGQQVPEDMRHPVARDLIEQCVAELEVEDDDFEEHNEAWVAQGYA
ncbi:MAG: flagellar biosynthesis protein FlhF [Methylococcales bacterium]|nr:flagellar biosynthesis protein FlhF [Methylococcales bacterium]